jgi:hypothetical protein
MKTKFLPYLLAGGVIVTAAWLVHARRETYADSVPEKYRATVQKGLAYLIKHQHADGHWEGEDGQHPVAMTGLVGLALLMEYDDPAKSLREGKSAVPIRKAVDWLLAHAPSEREGLLFSGHPSETTRYMEGHGLAMVFLAGALRQEPDGPRGRRFAEVVRKAVKYILRTQSSQGGWYHTSKAEGHDFADPLVTVMQIQALQAAANINLEVPSDCLRDAREYLRARLGIAEKARKGKPGQRRPTEFAGALATCRGQYGEIRLDETNMYEDWLKVCQDEIPVGRSLQFGRDELAHYYYAQVQLKLNGEAWPSYRTTMSDYLQSTQKHDGSWPSASGLGVGPVYATALWCTLLQMGGHHPALRFNVKIK